MKNSQKDCTLLGFDDRLFRLIGIPVVSLLIPLLFFRGIVRDMPSYLQIAGFGLFHTAATWQGVRAIFIAMSRRFPDWKDWKKRMRWLVVLSVLYTGIVCTLITKVGLLFSVQRDPTLVPDPLAGFGASYMMLLALGSVYESIRFFQLWKTTAVEKEHLERAHLASQLEGLRNQVNPHFLFNSLNTLTYLIPEAPEKAVRFVQQLSKVYRYVLESRDDRIIPLQTELEFLQSYIFLLRERFGENLQVEIGVNMDENAAIVPLTLQMLFENAIKHNIISTQKPLKIEVFMENGHLIVRNTLQKKNQVMDSTGVGLQNIRDRYRMLTDQTVEVIASQQYFTVILPEISVTALA
ncbi:MAG: histidine kinase [Saprospiraceae bacterium]|nr:histidine kinase [Saprospiraceae bacterium]